MLFNLNLKHIVNFLNLYEDLKKEKLPFKLSLILAKNNQIIEKEYDFYLEQRNQLMDKYFVLDEASGAYITLNKEYRSKTGGGFPPPQEPSSTHIENRLVGLLMPMI